MTETITAAEAYRKGYQASARTKTYDLEAAERRFTARWGSEHHDAFVAGWVDHASDNGFRPEAHGFGARPVQVPPPPPVAVDPETDLDGVWFDRHYLQTAGPTVWITSPDGAVRIYSDPHEVPAGVFPPHVTSLVRALIRSA